MFWTRHFDSPWETPAFSFLSFRLFCVGRKIKRVILILQLQRKEKKKTIVGVDALILVSLVLTEKFFLWVINAVRKRSHLGVQYLWTLWYETYRLLSLSLLL